MGSAIPKQFIELNGLPILMHTINKFHSTSEIDQIVLVLPASEHERWNNLRQQYSFTIPHTLVAGGETRFHSVRNGLMAIEGDGLVAIHDGVRPLVSENLISRCFLAAQEKGNAIPAIKPVETVRVGSVFDSKKANREVCWLVQTPQVFNLNNIKGYYLKDWKPEYTDDASVAEANGLEIFLIEGERENIKITNPLDLTIASAILEHRQKNNP
jgi:2-C-methyl-D-erythritol 4-phosphate cytidylyltransferase